jgi:hypothetical protein
VNITGFDGKSCAVALPTSTQPSQHKTPNIRCIELHFLCNVLIVAAAHIDSGESASLGKAAKSARKYAVRVS